MRAPKRHLYLLDLLKLGVLFSIQALHCWEFIFFDDAQVLNDRAFFFPHIASPFARVFSQGGQILVSTIYLLFGLHGRSRQSLLRISLFALLGQVVLTLIFMSESGFFSGLEWDIYIFLALNNVLLALIPEERRSWWIFSFAGFLGLCFSPPLLQAALPDGPFWDVLVGRYTPTNSGAWAPLPWCAIPLLFLSLGAKLRERPDLGRQWLPWEFALWGLALLGALPGLGHYYDTPVGPHYYQYNFSSPQLLFWANFVPVLLWLRLSLLDRVQAWLAAKPWMRLLSRSQWVRRLGVTYLVAVIYVGLGSQFEEQFYLHPFWMDAFFVSIFLVAETVPRALVFSFDRARALLDGPASR